jgi:hypothetical protein
VIPLIPVAHGLLIGRQDLPIPQWLFAWGASLVLIVSFVALSLLWREVRFEADRWRPVSERLSRALVNPVTSGLAGALGVVLLGVVIWAGLSGTDAPDLNFSLTFVFITAWLGLVVLSVLFGNVFRALNPWRAIARVGSAGFRLVAGQPGRAPLRYPERLGRWPAVAVIVGFVWLELIYGIGGFSSVGLAPRKATIAVIVYSVYTLMAMALFGIETWLDRGEGFSVFYGMFSRLAAPEVRDGRLGLRRLLSGTTHWATVSGSIGMVIIAIGTTTFDGSQEGVFKSPIDSLFRHLNDAGLGAVTAHRLAESVFLALSLAGVAAIFWLGVLGMRSVPGSPPLRELGARFAHTLIPIGLAYLVAHYFSYFVFGEQAQFTYLLSDPLGNGSDYFGTASGGIDYASLSATAVWYVQVAALITGHVTGLVLAHDRAIAVYGDVRRASLSQRWMLAVMVAFTCLGLFLLSQSNT